MLSPRGPISLPLKDFDTPSRPVNHAKRADPRLELDLLDCRNFTITHRTDMEDALTYDREDRDMVAEIARQGRSVFQCEECGLGYETQSIAQACEHHCRTHLACSLEIARQAVYFPDAH